MSHRAPACSGNEFTHWIIIGLDSFFRWYCFLWRMMVKLVKLTRSQLFCSFAWTLFPQPMRRCQVYFTEHHRETALSFTVRRSNASTHLSPPPPPPYSRIFMIVRYPLMILEDAKDTQSEKHFISRKVVIDYTGNESLRPTLATHITFWFSSAFTALPPWPESVLEL